MMEEADKPIDQQQQEDVTTPPRETKGGVQGLELTQQKLESQDRARGWRDGVSVALLPKVAVTRDSASAYDAA